MANSSDVNDGDLATHTQYNNLRADVLNTSTGHMHDGTNGRVFNLLARVWGTIDGTGALLSPDLNISSVTDTGTGDRTINFTTAFSDANYVCVATINTGGAEGKVTYFDTLAVGSVRHTIRAAESGYGLADNQTMVAMFGDQ